MIIAARGVSIFVGNIVFIHEKGDRISLLESGGSCMAAMSHLC